MLKQAKKTFLFLTMMLLLSCNTRTQVEKCSIKSLILDKGFFQISPDSVISEHLESPMADLPRASAGYSVYFKADSVINLLQHWVVRYDSAKAAEDFYLPRERHIFQTDGDIGPWGQPKELLPVVLNANQSRFACGAVGSERQCNLVAQYDTYYVFFSMTLSEKGLTIDNFVDGVNRIDELMTACNKE
jgi:hypothetical protein